LFELPPSGPPQAILYQRLRALAADALRHWRWLGSVRHGAARVAAEDDAGPRLRATVRYLTDPSGAEVSGTLRVRLAAAVRCLVQYRHALSEEEAREYEVALGRPAKSKVVLGRLEALLGKGSEAAAPALCAEAPLLQELLKREQAARLQHSAVDAVLREVEGHPEPVLSTSRSDSDEGLEPPLPEPEPPPKKRRKSVHTCRETYEELSRLSVASLRAKVRLYEVPLDVVWACLEKEDLVQALLDTTTASPADENVA